MSSAPTYSAPPRRVGTSAASASASAASAAPVSFSSFGRPARSEDNGRNGFDSAASAAFGKKPARTFEADSTPHKVAVVTPARNTLASILDDLLPSQPESKQREWSTSALQKQRKAEKAKPPPPKSFDEEFPTLGGAGGSTSAVAARIPKPVYSSESKSEPTTSGSFASLAANWAKTDAERKFAEESAARVRQEQEHREELERAARVHFRTNLNSTRNQYFHEYEDCEGGDVYDDDYLEGELDEEYSKKDIIADKRAAAISNHYSDEEEDEDTADYNIGTRTGGGAVSSQRWAN
jgi:hypothetical protein